MGKDLLLQCLMEGTRAYYVLKEGVKKGIWKEAKSTLYTCRVHTSYIKRENHYILLCF